MKVFDYFGNEIEVGDTVYSTLKGATYKVLDIIPTISGVNKVLVMENFFNPSEIINYIVFKENSYCMDIFLDVTKKDKEGAMKYHLLNSQIDGGS